MEFFAPPNSVTKNIDTHALIQTMLLLLTIFVIRKYLRISLGNIATISGYRCIL